MPVSKAMGILEAEIGTAFDPACVDALRRALDRIENREAQRGFA